VHESSCRVQAGAHSLAGVGAIRKPVENPSFLRGRAVAKKRSRKNPRRRRNRAKRRNAHKAFFLMPRKKHRKRSNPRRHHAKRRNPSHRRRRRNPGGSLDLIKSAAIAVAAGVAVGLAGTVLVNGALSSSTSTTKTGALAALAAGAALALPTHPALAAGIATGLLLIPGQQLLAGILPANLLGASTVTPPATTPVGSQFGPPSPPATSGLGRLYPMGVRRGMGRLYPSGVRAGMGDLEEQCVQAGIA